MAQPKLEGLNNNSEGEQEAGGTAAPPYVSFSTLQHCLEWLEQEGVPFRFDRSFWQRKYSGSVGPQLIGAFRFLGLLAGDRPTVDLGRIVEARGDDRKSVLRELMENAYSNVAFDQLSRATPAMLSEWIAEYPVTGDTRRKAESFLVNGLKYVDYPISPAIRKLARNRPSGVTRARRISPKKDDSSLTPPPKREPGEHTDMPEANLQIITLDSGGEVSVAVNVDLFRLSQRDRDWLMELVDHIRKYEEESQQADDEGG